MSMITDTRNLSMDDILFYSEVGLLDIEGADLIAQAFREGYYDGLAEGEGRDE